MNKEIKELLEKMSNVREQAMLLTAKSRDKLFDYITNLQQENERLNNQLDFIGEQNKYIDRLEKNIKDKVSRIDKAVEYIKEKISSTKGVINDYMYHKEHNKHLIELLKEDIEMYKKELNILQNGSEGNDTQQSN